VWDHAVADFTAIADNLRRSAELMPPDGGAVFEGPRRFDGLACDTAYAGELAARSSGFALYRNGSWMRTYTKPGLIYPR